MGFERRAVAAHILARVASGRRYVSHVCAMEMAIKQSIGKLRLPPSYQTNFTSGFMETVRELSAEMLPIELDHIDTLSRLPLHHRDPFDRLIISQAIAENLTLVSRDRVFAAYPGLDILEI